MPKYTNLQQTYDALRDGKEVKVEEMSPQIAQAIYPMVKDGTVNHFGGSYELVEGILTAVGGIFTAGHKVLSWASQAIKHRQADRRQHFQE